MDPHITIGQIHISGNMLPSEVTAERALPRCRRRRDTGVLHKDGRIHELVTTYVMDVVHSYNFVVIYTSCRLLP